MVRGVFFFLKHGRECWVRKEVHPFSASNLQLFHNEPGVLKGDLSKGATEIKGNQISEKRWQPLWSKHGFQTSQIKAAPLKSMGIIFSMCSVALLWWDQPGSKICLSPFKEHSKEHEVYPLKSFRVHLPYLLKLHLLASSKRKG